MRYHKASISRLGTRYSVPYMYGESETEFFFSQMQYFKYEVYGSYYLSNRAEPSLAEALLFVVLSS